MIVRFLTVSELPVDVAVLGRHLNVKYYWDIPTRATAATFSADSSVDLFFAVSETVFSIFAKAD